MRCVRHAWMLALCAASALLGCSHTNYAPELDVGARPDGGAGMDAGPGTDAALDAVMDAGESSMALEVQALGVQGFVLTHRGESVMTAPLFTRQSTVGVTLSLPIDIDEAAIDEGLAETPLADVRAIVSGHAHFDHLLDVVHILPQTPAATLYANRSARHIFAALAPDRDASCTSPAPAVTIDRARVVALDDLLASHVDYTNCPAQLPPGASLDGSWVSVPGSRIRLMPVCTSHPAQIGPIHFGEGSVDTDLCDLPAAASGWLEGQTLSFVIDFLDDAGAPVFRIYYQDAPATTPVGEVPASILAEHRVDVAILCVGSNDAVMNQPTDIIANLDPRFVLSGHWEDFFRPLDQPIQPIVLLNVDEYVIRAEAALAAPADAPLVVDGAEIAGRHVLIMPGSRLVVPAAP